MSTGCPICRNGYGEVCKPCLADPANADWVETGAGERRVLYLKTAADEVMEWGRPTPDYTDDDRLVAAGILANKTNAEIARDTGISPMRVAKIRRRFMS